jgi:hypothetical protein
MVSSALIRQYANSARVSPEVAGGKRTRTGAVVP